MSIAPGPIAARPTTAVVIPCYNEAARLPAAELAEFAREHREIRLILVNDGSADQTAEILEQLAANNPSQITVLTLNENRGKAEAVRRGMLHALSSDAELAGYWDADLATPLDAIGALADVLRSRPEVQCVLGSRVRLLGRSIDRRPLRHYLGRVFATLASLLLRLPVYDTQCGAKLFRNSPEVTPLFAEPFRTGWVFDVELLARYVQQQRAAGQPERALETIYEYPLLRWRDVRGSKLKATDMPRALWQLGVIYRHYLRGGAAAVAATSSPDAADNQPSTVPPPQRRAVTSAPPS